MFKSKDQSKPQHERFIEAACQPEYDEDKERFEDKLNWIAKIKSKRPEILK